MNPETKESIQSLIEVLKKDPEGFDLVLGVALSRAYLKQDHFTSFVREAIRKHPDWFGEALLASQQGVLEAVDSLKDAKANVETGLSVLLTAVNKTRVSEGRRGLVARALKSVGSFYGTPFYKDMLEKWGKP